MKIPVYYCEGDDYSKECFYALIENRLLHHFNGEKLEVSYSLDPIVKGHSSNRFNVMFEDLNDELPEGERKYFAHINQLQKFILIWSYRNYWIQKTDNVWKVFNPILTFVLGYILAN
ncbi:MAG: hypothetical protein IPO49_09860 [Bacteroidetes bacterium]|nr:hypothetical protein [Bacteroidota bacterium]